MRIHKGDTVRHFKRETLTLEQLEDNINLYLYRVLDFARHTETGELLVIYEALYSGGDVCCGDNLHDHLICLWVKSITKNIQISKVIIDLKL